MKILFDLFPVILFFVVYKFSGNIYLATKVAISAAVLQLLYAKFIMKKVEFMMWVSTGILVVFGGLTILFKDSGFVQWKPTIVYWFMATALLYNTLVLKRNLIHKLMSEQASEQISVPPAVWNKLNYAWIAFFICMGSLNLIIAYSFSENTWVNFKLWSMAFPFIFAVGQIFFISRHIQEKDSKS